MPRQNVRTTRTTVEPLESRRMLTVLARTGTAGEDAIAFGATSAFYIFELNGVTELIPRAGVTGFRIDALGARDSIILENNAVPTTLLGGAGDDTISFCDGTFGAGNLDVILADVAVDGGVGDDEVVLDDENSTASGDTYTITSTTFDRTFFPLLTYADCEHMTLHSGQGSSALNVSSIPQEFDLQVNAQGGADRLTLGTGDLNSVNAYVTFNAGSGEDALVLEDAASTANMDYTIEAGRFLRRLPGGGVIAVVNYTGLQNLTLRASLGANQIDVEQSPAGDGGAAAPAEGERPTGNAALAGAPSGVLTLVGGDGNDVFRLAPAVRNLNEIRARVDVDGSDGFDTITLFDQNYAGSDMYPISVGAVDWSDLAGDGSLGHANLEGLTLNGAALSGTFNLASTDACAVTINGGNGADVLSLTDGNLGSIHAAVTFNAGGGSDIVRLNDQDWTVPASYTIGDAIATWGAVAALHHNGAEELYLRASTAADTITVAMASAVTWAFVDAGNGADTIHVDGTTPGTYANVETGAGDDVITINRDNAGSAHAIFSSAQRIASLDIGAGGAGTLVIGGDRTLLTSALTISPTGLLNVTDNAVIVDYTSASPVAAIGAMLAQGHNGGAWNGRGISSSNAAASGNTAVGYAEASEIFTSFPGTFAGQSVDNTAVLIRHTFYGDANLDGAVNLQDFNRLAASFGQVSRRWSQGDFNFDATVNLLDFNRLAANFGAAAAGTRGAGEATLPADLEEAINLLG